MKSFTIIIFLLFFSAVYVVSQTTIPGGDVSGLWVKDQSPYIITGSIVVSPNNKLAIEPGVEVLFDGPYVMEVHGRLEASGTESESIYFGMVDTAGFSNSNYEGWLGLTIINIVAVTSEPSMLSYCEIEHSAGSGLTCYYGKLEARNLNISNNKGFGIYLTTTTEAIFEDVQINNNELGGVKSENSALLISDFVINNNSGSGIMVVGSINTGMQSIIEQGLISNNTTNGVGGGAFIGMDAFVLLEDVSIEGNIASHGGGIYSDMANVEMVALNISNNEAFNGGGISLDSWSNVSVKNSLIAGNTAEQSGSAICNYNSNLEIDRSTIANNISGEMGSGIEYLYVENKNNSIRNSILWENFPQEILTSDEKPEVEYCDIKGGYEGFKIKNVDPLFLDAENNNYQLTWDNFPLESGLKSPAIDGGDPSTQFDPDGTIADMGAYYFEQTIYTITNDIVEFSSLNVFPNPATNYISIVSENDISEVQILNIAGQIVWNTTAYDFNSKINISSLEKGLYIIKVTDKEDSVMIDKLIKE